MVDASRLRISQRHFARMKLVAAGDAYGPPSAPMKELIVWGLVAYDGHGYSLTPEGQKAWDTWNGLNAIE